MRICSRRGGRLVVPALLVLAVALPGAAAAQEDARAPDGTSGASYYRSFAQGGGNTPTGGEFAPGQIIVKFEEGASRAEEADARRDEGLRKKEDLDLVDAEVAKVEGQSVEQAVRDLNARPDVEYAEPDRLVHPMGYGDEERFGELWGLHNTGQPVLGKSGSPDADVDAPEASAVTQGDEDLVVAVIDDGVDFSHPDLAGRAWVNADEVPNNNVDDDGNGYIDDVNGYDFANDENTVHDAGEDFHGTHVAGTIAASSNTGGVVGVAPNVKIMAVKFLGPLTTLSSAIGAIDYAAKNGAKISNNSWGYLGPPSPALEEAVERSGMLFVAAAGNDGFNNDGEPDLPPEVKAYPASFDSPNILSVAAVDNILSVAAVDNTGAQAPFSNYGANTVDVGAPGVDVLSAVPEMPGRSGAALASVEPATVGRPPGKALVAGFGIEEISGEAQRAEFVRGALDAVGHGVCEAEVCAAVSPEVVVVDDDRSNFRLPWAPELVLFPDVAPTIAAAVEEVTGRAPEVIEVGDADGPNLGGLVGKTVIWATGKSFLSTYPLDQQDPIRKNLTFVDQNNMARFLKEDGGKLVLTGMHALYLNEGGALVRETLGMEVDRDYPATVFAGAAGSDFAAESYDLNNRPFADAFYHDAVAPIGPGASTQGDILTPKGHEEYYSGTSMAAPHATGVAALSASAFPDLLGDPVALKRAIMGSGQPLPALKGKTVTGKMVNALGAVTDVAPTVSGMAPAPNSVTNDRTPTVRATVGDLHADLEKADVTLTLDGKDVATFSYDRATDRLAYTPSTNLAYGKHNVTVSARDSGGLSTTRSWSFTVNGPPGISRLTPAPGSRTRDRTPNVAATVSDVQTDLASSNVSLYLDGRKVTARYDRGTDRLSYTPGSAMAFGTHKVRVVARDAQGLTATRTWGFRVTR